MAKNPQEMKALLLQLNQPRVPPNVIEEINQLLHDGSLRGVDLRGIDLVFQDLVYANLSGANLAGADLLGLLLQGADLSEANLSGANLNRADLGRANLAHASLRGARLAGAVLGRVNLEGANLRSAYLKGARFILDDYLRKAHAMRFAIMPDGSCYDGRFRLPGDLEEASSLGVDLNDETASAQFYQCDQGRNN